MPLPRPALTGLVASLVLAAALAGCIGGTEEAPPAANTVDNKTENKTAFVNPTGTTSAAANETNKTVVGKGGIEHLHDYWEGQTEKIIFEDDLYLSGPTFCDNKDTSKMGCVIVQLPVTDPATLVYEGASEVQVTVSAVKPWVEGLQMRYKNGANPSWSEILPLQPDVPAVLTLTAADTDMPHASASQWAWKFVSTRSLSFAAPEPDFHLQIKAVKGGRIVDWPGHPDFYADKPYRVVMDKDATTSINGIVDGFLYGDEANIVRPDLLISSGTGSIKIYLNVSAVRAQTGEVKPDRFFLEYTNATGYWDGDYTESNIAGNRVFGEAISQTEYVFTIPVKYTGWDSPYAPSSGWQFLIKSDYQGFCNGCLPYEVDFHMTVIAFPDPQYLGGDALEA
ncbi:MAG TPA: hypothetical protein VNZ52_06035 [Candidatus Thermoplasmatota archaeon]|nr:hypothetical protein [Candidatus Thermoplasmatota archaeon]